MQNTLNALYRPPLSMLTDLYQLTMAYGYWKHGIAEREAVFHLFFRKAPFGGRFAVACGQQLAAEWLQNFQFSEADVTYLARLRGADGKMLFDEHFLNYLQRLRFSCDVEALQEGEIVFPNEPILRVRGSLLQAQLIETALLNLINFSTLIATKAARVRHAAQDDQILEFGLRRAQSVDGSLSASRAAYIGGCDATSNVLAGQMYNIPIRGTHAHAWVMAFEDEMTAFERYAEAMPNNCTFLVDTFDTLQGVKNAIEMGKKLRTKGFDLQGIRLDSGNLLTLSIEARKLLDAAGFERTNIVASNDLDEYEIQKLKAAGAKINVWGVGTRLVTAYDQPALGGVYKLAALKGENGEWDYKIKLSEDPIKISTPGILNVRRVNTMLGAATEGGGEDIIFDETDFGALPEGKNLLQPMFKKGKFIAQNIDIQAIKNFAAANIKKFYAPENQHFTVRLDEKLKHKKELLAKANRQ